MDIKKIIGAFVSASELLIAQETELSELDALTGDGDHGVTVAKIGKAIIRAAEKDAENDLSEFLYCIFDEIMTVNGGSIGPLWALMADGAAEALKSAPEGAEAVKLAFAGALSGVREVSNAKPGEKSLADPLCAAVKASANFNGSAADALEKAAESALAAAEATRGMPAKFGRAKNLPDKGLGFLDPGAVSFARFVGELSRSYKEAVK